MVTTPLHFKNLWFFMFIGILSLFLLSGCSLIQTSLNESQLDLISGLIKNISRGESLEEGEGIYDKLEESGILSNKTEASISLLKFSNVTIPLNKEYQIPFKAFCNGVEVPIKYHSPVSRNGIIKMTESSPPLIETEIEVECIGETRSYDYVIRAKQLNNPPVIKAPNEIAVLVNHSIDFFYYVYDLDSDFLNFWIDGWKTNLSYTPTMADLGTHKIFLHASDGENHVEKTVLVHVINGDYSNFFGLNIFKA